MASYLLSFDAFADDITSVAWKILTLDPSDAAFANPACGHHAFDISGSDSIGGNTIEVGVAWVDCDSNKNNAIIGVTKYVTIDMINGTRRTGLNNSSGRYVYETITVTGSSNPIRTLGIGSMIDNRQSPKSGIVRKIMVGWVNADLGGGDVQLIITPTRII